MFSTTIRVALNQRAVVFVDGAAIRALGPGKHRIWKRDLTVFRFDTDDLILDAPREVRAAMPAEWIDEVMIGLRQRGILYRDGRPRRFLRPGQHRFWTVDPSVELRVVSIDDPVPEMTDELAAVIPHGEIVEAQVNQYQRGLKYVQGKFDELLGPGRHAFWSHPASRVSVQLIDARLQQVTIAGQELMTRDKVTLRLTLTAEFAPADPPTSVHTVVDVQASIYLLVQLAARDYVAGVTLDELLEGRDQMTRAMEATVVPKAAEMGVEVRNVGVKDVVLPGEMKQLLNRVIEAEKEAAANVILRREEAAATRQMANTAKIMADNPVLMKLKELEALKDMSAQIDELKLIVGAGDLEGLVRGGLLKDRN